MAVDGNHCRRRSNTPVFQAALDREGSPEAPAMQKVGVNGIESIEIFCPYCGEGIGILIDCSVGRQSYLEDCQVCCRPISIRAVVDESGFPRVEASAEDA